MNNILGDLLEKKLRILLFSEQELGWEHFIDGNRNVVFGMVSLKSGVYLIVLFWKFDVGVDAWNLFDDFESYFRFYRLITIDFF